MLGREVDTSQVHGVIDHLREFGLAFLLGNTIVALTLAALFGVSLFLVLRHYGRAGMRKMLMRSRTEYPSTPTPPAS
jgi:hypothetical protein